MLFLASSEVYCCIDRVRRLEAVSPLFEHNDDCEGNESSVTVGVKIYWVFLVF
jgi:hypothetical protein